MPSALGCDFSTHALHLARVGRTAVEAQTMVKLDGKTYDEQVLAASQAIREIGCNGETLLVEKPFIHRGERQNYDTSLRLMAVAAMVRTLGSLSGLRTIEMLASEWRPIAGIPATARTGRYKRADLKGLAIHHVKLEFGIDLVDDNAAEAILMARVAYILQHRNQLIAETLP
jgi:hypothetical protein